MARIHALDVSDDPLLEIDVDPVAFSENFRGIWQLENRQTSSDGIAEPEPGRALCNDGLHAPDLKNSYGFFPVGTGTKVFSDDKDVTRSNELIELRPDASEYMRPQRS